MGREKVTTDNLLVIAVLHGDMGESTYACARLFGRANGSRDTAIRILYIGAGGYADVNCQVSRHSPLLIFAISTGFVGRFYISNTSNSASC
jgi:hypothetical protein